MVVAGCLIVAAKAALEVHLKNRTDELIDLEYDLLMYESVSNFIEGQAGHPGGSALLFEKPTTWSLPLCLAVIPMSHKALQRSPL